jgi:RimJ/RimL family protein N-acetyltransferase
MSVMIETPRLYLRLPEPGDIEAVHAAKKELWAVLQKWMSWSSDEQGSYEATKSFILSAPAQAPWGNYTLFAFKKQTHEFVVATGLTLIDGHEDEYMTGYWAAKSHWGQGYATEATIAAIRYGFEVLQAKKIHTEHYEGNEKSAHIIEKLGFIYRGLAANQHQCHLDGAMLDVHIYEMADPHSLPELSVKTGS